MASRLEGDYRVTGDLTAKTVTLPAGTVTDDKVSASAGIKASKLQHQHAIGYSQAVASDVVSEEKPIHQVRGVNATALELEVVVKTPPAGGDKKFTVDLLVSNEASPTPVSILSSVITIDTTVAAFEVKTASISAAALADGDTLTLKVVASGTTGTQGKGVNVTATIREDAD